VAAFVLDTFILSMGKLPQQQLSKENLEAINWLNSRSPKTQNKKALQNTPPQSAFFKVQPLQKQSSQNKRVRRNSIIVSTFSN